MEFKNNTVLITGGSSGVGLELAEKLIKKNNKVIICGRSLKKLEKAKASIPEIDIFQCDISKLEACEQLANWVKENYPKCNVLINNAAIVHRGNFHEQEDAIKQARAEIDTNLLAPIALSKLFIPLLEQNQDSQLINITTGLIYAPKSAYCFYNSTKAALHSFTQVLRLQMKISDIKIKEVMLPAVDTPWHNGNPPKIAISVQSAVQEMIRGMEKGKPEIRVAGVKIIYLLSRIAPKFAISKLNNLSKKEVAS